MNTIQCPRCGKFTPDGETNCQYCYKNLTSLSTPSSSRSSISSPPPSPPSPPVKKAAPPTPPGHTITSPRLTPPKTPPPTPLTPPPLTPVPHSPPSGPSFSSSYMAAPSPLPPHLAKSSPPAIEGIVKDSRELQVTKDDTLSRVAGSFLDAALIPINPTMAFGSLMSRHNKPKEKQTVYVVRIQRPDGTLGQAQIERDFQGATLEIGDYVSLWGVERNGVVSVKRGYNHTSMGEIIVK